jgi:hypothetical protein
MPSNPFFGLIAALPEMTMTQPTRMVPNFRPQHVGEALELLAHMIEMIGTNRTISGEDLQRVKDLAHEIKVSR